jgi:hypothetical protein
MVGSWKSCWLKDANAVLSRLVVLGSFFLNMPQNYFGLYFKMSGNWS